MHCTYRILQIDIVSQVPDASRRDVLLDWADKIHSTQLPSWLGLPNNAEKVLLQQRADKLLKNMLAVSLLRCCA